MYPKNLEILGKNKILICTHGKNNMQPLKEKFRFPIMIETKKAME